MEFIAMSILQSLFGGGKKQPPAEPIFPGESFSILELNMPDGLAFATVNSAYKDYQNKKHFPYLAGFELEILNKNDNGHPLNDEAEILNDLQDKIESFLKEKHTVHPVARVTRNGTRDILIYIDEPKFTKEEAKEFFDQINEIRAVNFIINKDPNWNSVKALGI
jgi:hypothetical protein